MEQAVKAVNVKEAGRMMGGAGRSMIYKLLAEGELRGVKLGQRRWIIPVVEIDAYLERKAGQCQGQ